MLPFSSSSSLYSYFSSHHHHDYIWRGGAHSLAERVSIKGGSTMRKMRGSKGPSGRRAAGLNAGVLGHMVCVCDSDFQATEMRAGSAKSDSSCPPPPPLGPPPAPLWSSPQHLFLLVGIGGPFPPAHPACMLAAEDFPSQRPSIALITQTEWHQGLLQGPWSPAPYLLTPSKLPSTVS